MKNSYIRRSYFTVSQIPDLITKINQIPVDYDDVQGVHLINNLLDKHEFDWILYKDTEVMPYVPEPEEELPEANVIKQWFNRFKVIYDTTRERYLSLLIFYTEAEGHLLDKIGSETINKFNDTPQNVGVGETDDYTSTVSKSTTSVDPGELINRLKNISKNYEDVEAEWMKEFEPLFGNSII